ncbi:MAG: SlyX family protein [Acinetobacter sp.]|nr:SlyX family protein [Acinetobacter sp.]
MLNKSTLNETVLEKNNLEQTIADLQIRIAFLDDWIEQLSDKVAQQDKELIDLNKKLHLLYQRVQAADLSEGIAPFDPLLNVPPHY